MRGGRPACYALHPQQFRPAHVFTRPAAAKPSYSTEDLLAHIVFSLQPAAVREVVIGGRMIVEDGRHHSQKEITEKFVALQKRLWS